MVQTSQIVYQPYVAGPRGSLKPGTAMACRTPEDAMRRANKALENGSILGARVARVTHDDAAEEFGEPEFLGQVGRVPDME